MRTRSSKYDLALGPEKTDGIMNKRVGGKSGLEFRCSHKLFKKKKLLLWSGLMYTNGKLLE